jgi:hypothetical protein
MRLILAFLLLIPTVFQKKAVELKITVIVDEDSEIFIGKKKIKLDDIPDEGVIADLEMSNNKVKKVVFEEKK